MLYFLLLGGFFDFDTFQVRDYRKGSSEPGSGSSLTDRCPLVSKVCLRMSLENVVKDIPMLSDNSWTYGDLMVSIFTHLILSR